MCVSFPGFIRVNPGASVVNKLWTEFFRPGVLSQPIEQRLPISSCGAGRHASIVAHMRALLFFIIIVLQSEMKGRKLFITSRNDLGSGNRPRLPTIRAHYERAPESKELIVLEGSAHAQFIFATDQGERLMREILRFLCAP